MAHELRCDRGNLLGIIDGRAIEIRCKAARCGAGAGVVIIHRFSVDTGVLLSTSKYRDPATRKEGSHGSR